MIEQTVCQYLEWDSDFFGFKIGRLNGRRLTPVITEDAIKWCRDNKIDCLYFLADSDDDLTVKLLENKDFHLVDIRVNFLKTLASCEVKKNEGPEIIRSFREEDLPLLREIAKMSGRDTRFYYDDHFKKSLCEKLYEIWIEKNCRGGADLALVAEYQKQPIGYITAHRKENGTGEIDLLAVSEDFQGRGFGKKLVYESLEWFSKQGIGAVRVAARGRSYKAQRLYQNCGFRTSSLQLWYHRWFLQNS